MSIKRYLANLTKAKVMFAAGLFAVFGLFAVAAPAAYAATGCDNNAIMYCGYSSKSNFIAKVQGNNSGNGVSDLKALYNTFGFTSSDYQRFISKAVPATVDRAGKVYVNGQVVGTNAVSYGRSKAVHDGPGLVTKRVGDHYIYGNKTSKTFVSQSTFPAHVLFDANGTAEFIVLEQCGNPVTVTQVKSAATCDMLNATPVAGKPTTYSFTTNASRSGLASITKYVYDFGDGKTATVTSGSAVTHTYAKPGQYTAKVTVYASAPGGTTITATSAKCTKTINIPYYSCVSLKGPEPDGLTYSFVATAQFGNGAQFVSADFDFGDGSKQAGVKPSGTTARVSHTYAKEGTYSVSALLKFNVAGTMVTAPACKATVAPKTPPVPECKPGIPVGDERCTPCPYNPDLPKDDENCVQAVTELPNTGAGNAVAVSAIALIGGFLAYRHLLFKKHKAEYMAAEQGTSALPLADPLNSDNPLVGTPYEEKTRRGFGRRRQF